MENKNANQPAFPEIKTSHENGYISNERWDYGNTYSTGGLTKREYFAALNMAQMIAANWTDLATAAKSSIKGADELLKYLETQ